MSVAPIVKSVTVKQTPARAFEIFTRDIGRWWPAGKTLGRNPHANIVIEPRAGGRWFEVDAEGAEAQWGKVLAFEPPSRLLLGWQLDSRFAFDPDFLTEVEITFVAAGAGETLVTLEHRNLERYGADAERYAGLIGEGWPARLAEFASYANATTRE
jgi:uncharacterized protein YndB with AHSA1/START domain